MNKKFQAGLVSLALVAGSALSVSAGSMPASARAAAGSSPDNPIIVASPDDVPDGAVEIGSVTNDDCSTTTTWRLTIPGSDEISHQEFRFLREVPEVPEQSHQVWGTEERTRTKTENTQTQYRFRTRVPIFGQKEIKEVYGWNFGGSGTTVVNGFTIPGQWFQSAGWHEIHPAVINAVWASGDDIPDHVLGTGTVALSVYGGPSGVTVQYQAYTVQTEEGFTPWSDWSDWSVTNPGPPSETREVETRQHPDGTFTFGNWSEWTTRTSGELTEPTLPPDTDTHQFRLSGPELEITVPGVDAFTEYFVLGGEPSREEADASWIQIEQLPADQGWQQFDERTVVTEDGTPEVVTYYAYNDGDECTDPEVETPPTEDADAPPARDADTPPAEVVTVPRTAPSRLPAKAPAGQLPTVINAGL